MTDRTQPEREAFEQHYSDGGKWPKSVERDEKGQYILMSAANAWIHWQAAWQERSTRAREAAEILAELVAATNDYNATPIPNWQTHDPVVAVARADERTAKFNRKQAAWERALQFQRKG